jgi:chaperonin GroES
MNKIELFEDRLLVLADPEIVQEKSDGGIYLPEAKKTNPLRGTVLHSGPGRITEIGFIPNQLREGDRILYGPFSYDTIEVDGQELLMIRERDVKARIWDKATDEDED